MNKPLSTEIDGIRFRLWLDADGFPYVLKRRTQLGARPPHWGIVWANWHKGLPRGLRARAVRQMGFEWRNDTPENLGWYRVNEEESK